MPVELGMTDTWTSAEGTGHTETAEGGSFESDTHARGTAPSRTYAKPATAA